MMTFYHQTSSLFGGGKLSFAVSKSLFGETKLLQKSEMRKDIVIELSYKGFSCASDYS